MTTYVPSKGESGFTLIELLVVILIIGLLAAIGIPALLSQRDKAKNTDAKATARVALTASMTYYIEGETYKDLDHAALHRIEPSIKSTAPSVVVPGDDADPHAVWIGRSTGGTVQRVTSTTPAGPVIVLCSVSKGTAIACVIQSHTSGLVAFKEFDSERPENLVQVGGVGVMPVLPTSTTDAANMGPYTTIAASPVAGGWTSGF